MKLWPHFVIGLVMVLSISCSKIKFTEGMTLGESNDIKVMDPAGDGTSAPGTTTVSVEGPDGKDSALGADSRTSGDLGLDTADSGSGKGGSNTGTNSADSVDSGSDGYSGKGPQQGNGEGSEDGGDAGAVECASAVGINKDRVKVSGNQKNMILVPGDAFALKVTGNQNVVHLKMTGDGPSSRVTAICLFLGGNQNLLTMEIGVSVGKIIIKSRGNKALVEGTISKGGVIENLQVDANGNQPSIVLKGEGTYPCNQTAVLCSKP